ncbi:hypothetical protein AC579_6979 [Pseudocercospora musae]|uniref:FAD-binding PCMH-type domain-containing protein n=1 Tax=Pseudocercospora musae TaxID=113226 RepID=A0A139IAG8_9PEZI|nr:hypothetical protein AC579_6979 [Pseudocercospora musae]KXT11725.1 hypothetical protein AC579_6979 [Pseudocercospora musae]
MRSVYAIAKKENLTIVGGSNQSVGVGGWIGGGGHSPISARFGLGADQVIEMEVVTADGAFRTINAEKDEELFWAMRGGEFAYFWICYDRRFGGLLESCGLAPSLTEDQIRSILGPVEDEITKAKWGDPVYITSSQKHTDNFIAYWRTATADEAAGFPGARLGSRLLSNESLLGDFDKLKSALRTSTPAPWSLLGHLVALAPNGPQVVKGIAGGTDAVPPAWRKSYVHAVVSRSWLPLNRTSLTNVTTDLRDVRVAALRDIEPDTGAYMSESDPTEPDWQMTKFGENYTRLLRIKKEYDPEGLFWCKQCAGSELWSTEGELGIENGVGQNRVRLCRGHDGWRHGDWWASSHAMISHEADMP